MQDLVEASVVEHLVSESTLQNPVPMRREIKSGMTSMVIVGIVVSFLTPKRVKSNKNPEAVQKVAHKIGIAKLAK